VAGACAFHELEHDSYWHLSRAGVETLMQRHAFFPYYLQPSEYSGAVLAAQRHFGGGGRISTSDLRSRLLTIALGLANSIPFLIANLMEALRRLSPMFDPFQDCATLFFMAARANRQPGDARDEFVAPAETEHSLVSAATMNPWSGD
jgi:hypothetical protein